MAELNTTRALNETQEAFARTLAAMEDAELLTMEPTSPLEAELMLRLETLRDMLETADERAAEYGHELRIREWVDRQAAH